MAFGQISKALAIPTDAVAVFKFYEIHLCAAGPVELVCRHAGDGTPGYRRAMWNESNAKRAERQALAKNMTEPRIKMLAYEEARRIADHCIVSWINVVEEGSTEPAPCVPEKVCELFCALIDAPDGLVKLWVPFREWIQDASNFRPIVDGTALGK